MDDIRAFLFILLYSFKQLQCLTFVKAMKRNNMIKYIIGILCFVSLMSCQDSITVEVFDEEGNLMERYEATMDTVKNGLYESFYEGGQIFSSVNYDHGLAQGEWKVFFEDGTLKSSEFYLNDTIHGPFKEYYDNGRLNLESEFVHGVLQGVAKRYFITGELMEEVTFENNEENGPFKEYYKNGQLQWSGTYLNGDNEFGLLEHYNEEGILDKKMICDSLRKCRTIWTLAEGDISQ